MSRRGVHIVRSKSFMFVRVELTVRTPFLRGLDVLCLIVSFISVNRWRGNWIVDWRDTSRGHVSSWWLSWNVKMEFSKTEFHAIGVTFIYTQFSVPRCMLFDGIVSCRLCFVYGFIPRLTLWCWYCVPWMSLGLVVHWSGSWPANRTASYGMHDLH